MLAVVDTSTLNYLIRLGVQDALPAIYGRILAPHAVLLEMRHPEAPDMVREWAVKPPTWLEEVQVAEIESSLPTELGAGEREAISLALATSADVLVVDDWAGRQAAEALKIQVAGTLSVLLKTSLLERSDFRAILTRLLQLGFRASRAVQADMLARYEEARRDSASTT